LVDGGMIETNAGTGDPAEKTGRSAAEELVRHVKAGGCVDEHLQDQVLPLTHCRGLTPCSLQ